MPAADHNVQPLEKHIMAIENHTGAPARHPADAPRSVMHAAGVEARLHRTAGGGLRIRYFVLHAPTPRLYRTAAAALQARAGQHTGELS